MVEYTVPLLIRHKQNGRRPLSEECADVKKKKRKKKKKEHASDESVKNRTHVLSTAFDENCFVWLVMQSRLINHSWKQIADWIALLISMKNIKKAFLVFNLAAIVRSWVKNQGTTFKVYAWHACGSMSRKYRWIGALRKQQLLCLVSKKKIQTVCIEFEMISNFLPREDGMHLGYSLCVRIEWWIFCRSRWVSSLTLLRF